METFKINKELEVICAWKKTRNGFKHTATLMRSGREIEEVKICYVNRTWERYTYESVLQKLLGKTKSFLTPSEIAQFEEAIKNGGGRDMAHLKSIAIVAELGNIFGRNQTEKNDWKMRMLKAGLGNSGLIVPEDWDTLDEDTKQARVDGAIKMLA